MSRKSFVLELGLTLVVALAIGRSPVTAQAPSLDSLVARALSVSPELAAARHRVEAARARGFSEARVLF